MKILKTIIRSVLLFGIWGIALTVYGQEAEQPNLREQYLSPPESIAEEVLAPRHKNISPNVNDFEPASKYFINTVESAQMAPLSLYAKPYYNLAGLQVDKSADRNRNMTIEVTGGFEIVDSRTGDRSSISTPENAVITDITWSPDGSKLAYFAHFEKETHIYISNTGNRKSKRITPGPVLATLFTDIRWAPDSRHLYTVLVPEERPGYNTRPAVPETPQIRMTSDKENRLRTYQSLLKDRHEAALFEYYTTGQLSRIDTRDRGVTKIGSPAMFSRLEPSPDGDYLIVRKLKKPFPYIVPYYDFAWTEQVWDLEGNIMTELRYSEVDAGVPDVEEVKDHGRKDIKWRPDGNGLSMILEPEDKDDENGSAHNGDSSKESDEKGKEKKTYKVAQWLPPFEEGDIQILYKTDKEMDWVNYNIASDILFIREDQGKAVHLYAVFSEEADTIYTIYRHKDDDFYNDPGQLSFTKTGMGQNIVRTTDDSKVYLSGTQYYENYTERAPRPFLDRVDIRSGEKERIFQSEEDMFEEVTKILADDASELIIERQSPTDYPDFWLYETESGDRTQITENVDYNSEVSQAKRKRFKVKRADGFEFWVEVVLPREWDGEPLPGLLWHYPREYDDQEDYDKGMRDYNKNDFPGVYRRTTDILVKRGYAVVDADWPIAAERGAPNEGFVWSIVQNSTAVLDSAAARGYIDRHRMAIGGHSYGAFGTANAMIHTSFFKAGIAGDGNYNRTLTPMGFQREPNDLWRGLDKYLEMSPIFWADRLDGALLMYHGEADQNVGTWPVHSKRMFHALNGIGKPAAMYMYPHEAHGPGAEETLLDLWKRWSDWLDHYVKNAGEHVEESALGDG